MTSIPVTVTDAGDHRLDDYRSLNDQLFRRGLEGDEFFIIEGFVAVDRLIQSGHRVRSVLLSPSRVDRFARHLDDLTAAGVPVVIADNDVIAATVGFDLHRGVVAAAWRRPHPSIAGLASTATRLAVLEGLNDAENLGAIARAARALGVDALVIDERCTDPYSRRSVRVSMGEILMLPVARVATAAWSAVFDTLHGHGFETWALTPSSDADSIWDIAPPSRVAMVLGAEGPGLDRRTLAMSTRRVRIPLQAGVDSLNVGHAAAVTFAAVGRPRSRRHLADPVKSRICDAGESG